VWVPDSSASALDQMTRLVAVPIILSAAEIVLSGKEIRAGGLLDWSLTSRAPVSHPLDKALRRSAAARVLSPRGTVSLNLLQISCGAVLLWRPREVAALLLCLAVTILMSKRHHQSLEGSDEMTVLLLGAAVLRSVSGATMVQDATVCFVAAQVGLAYLTAGLSKTQSWEWWTGWGLPRILSTRYFGHPLSSRLMWRYRPIALGSSWTVMLWESLFVLCFALPPKAALGVVAIGLALHLACAVTMSLSMFVWAYVACYPCVLLANAWVNEQLSSSQRLSSLLAGAVLIVGTGAFFAGRVSAEPPRTRPRAVRPPAASQPVAPQPVAPQPVAPQPVAPQPVAPQPAVPVLANARQPVAPAPAGS
jgi:hypothetical protein